MKPREEAGNTPPASSLFCADGIVRSGILGYNSISEEKEREGGGQP